MEKYELEIFSWSPASSPHQKCVPSSVFPISQYININISFLAAQDKNFNHSFSHSTSKTVINPFSSEFKNIHNISTSYYLQPLLPYCSKTYLEYCKNHFSSFYHVFSSLWFILCRAASDLKTWQIVHKLKISEVLILAHKAPQESACILLLQSYTLPSQLQQCCPCYPWSLSGIHSLHCLCNVLLPDIHVVNSFTSFREALFWSLYTKCSSYS